MLEKYILTFIFIFAGHVLLGQDANSMKKKLKRVLTQSILQPSKTKVQTNSNPWTICNQDSSYFKSDTILLYPANNSYYRFHSQCCDFIDWTFYKQQAFVLTRVQICKEPPTISVTKSEDWFTIKVLSQNQNIYMQTFNQGKLIDRFKVIGIEPMITLVRTTLQ